MSTVRLFAAQPFKEVHDPGGNPLQPPWSLHAKHLFLDQLGLSEAFSSPARKFPAVLAGVCDCNARFTFLYAFTCMYHSMRWFG